MGRIWSEGAGAAVEQDGAEEREKALRIILIVWFRILPGFISRSASERGGGGANEDATKWACQDWVCTKGREHETEVEAGVGEGEGEAEQRHEPTLRLGVQLGDEAEDGDGDGELGGREAGEGGDAHVIRLLLLLLLLSSVTDVGAGSFKEGIIVEGGDEAGVELSVWVCASTWMACAFGFVTRAGKGQVLVVDWGGFGISIVPFGRVG
jgi:hypothetical protein